MMERVFVKSPFLRSTALAFVLAILLTAAARPAQAACESGSAVSSAIATMNSTDIEKLNLLILQEVAEKTTTTPDNTGGFAPNIMRSALAQLIDYFLKFGENILKTLTSWASEDWLKGLKGMTQELHVAQVDQTHQIGLLTDRKLLMEDKLRFEKYLDDAHRRYAPSELACEVDSVGPGLAKAYQIARGLNHGLTLDDNYRRNNLKGSPAETGKAADVTTTWREYVSRFCDNTMGDMGCTAPGTFAGKHLDLAGMLWGPKQTIDPSNPDNVLIMNAALKYFINPIAPDPLTKTTLRSALGRQSMLERRSEQTYINTIYNTVGAMLSERIGGSGVNVQLMRAASGVPIENASPDASYREIMQAITRDRFNNPTYLVRMIGDPNQIVREQSALHALRLQTLNDIYRRTEERLFMDAAAYGRELNEQIPGAAATSIPFQTPLMTAPPPTP